MNFSNFFNEYGYQPSKGWVGYKKQLEEQKMKTEFHDKFDKGFVPGSPVPEPPKPKPKAKCLTFTAVEDDSSVAFNYWVGPGPGTIPDLGKNMQYSTNGGKTWQEYAITNSYQTTQKIVLQHEGDSVMFKGNNETLYSSNPNGRVKCSLTGKVAASGDITSLLNGVGGDIPIPERCFHMFFFQNPSLVAAPNLPSTTLADNCYYGMFQLCSQLNSITVGLSSIPYDEDNAGYPYTTGWLDGVAETGTFKWNGPVPYDGTRNASSIPSGWAVENI